ncbi:MAG: transcriptional regulator [Thiothrix lacustris]|uniref:Transcriptional regulator n=1 Tax=Thiothrix lacustris TaxID=525917 RepID=A0A1Y1QCA1_9GAMM|nr:MAG: transcriptional regulator [Thiothrix lacustris]
MNEENTLLLFGKHIKSIRLQQNISQERLASLSELDRTYISGIERGKRNISLLNIVRLAYSLQITPAELLSFSLEENP